MKKIITKVVNRYTTGLFVALSSTPALAQPVMGGNVGWVAAGAIAIVTIVGVAAVSAKSNDDNDDFVAS
ncbi:hypothetical protein [Legionella septentrionalis]|uniref:Uncharacterized protein n=1 Tax=Legionella septentrionalis TaxID=2498109 RepID=A0A3S0X5S2_9GAMM|nr:hypothetical protein [Legionella septentrionalis]RUQ91046.1 hypothetical protein EKM59_00770 [Legionella septentrionalis]RUR02885.1 hypothetical protein ELY11_00575 [Legionella septentrionalis]RUR11483.1 hypothetical protein ELY14_01685 [Legionella septentrionalis]RUR16748.1 hypothetical protein ELY10_02400 [Legionella septentrionalis]